MMLTFLEALASVSIGTAFDNPWLSAASFFTMWWCEAMLAKTKGVSWWQL